MDKELTVPGQSSLLAGEVQEGKGRKTWFHPQLHVMCHSASRIVVVSVVCRCLLGFDFCFFFFFLKAADLGNAFLLWKCFTVITMKGGQHRVHQGFRLITSVAAWEQLCFSCFLD